MIKIVPETPDETSSRVVWSKQEMRLTGRTTLFGSFADKRQLDNNQSHHVEMPLTFGDSRGNTFQRKDTISKAAQKLKKAVSMLSRQYTSDSFSQKQNAI